ncbi:MarR family transcriptional regulator [Streptomyces sp. NPDC058671]|uniref:MarR family transcriptional regulator n=1 Tax=Streptomyces sp. NPDC058671 TaxID=3346590 RepID=UPI003646B4E9
MNAATASMQGDLVGISTSLCLCVCAAGLFVEAKEQQALHLGQRILARVATHPEITAVQTARAVSCSTRTAEISLERLAAEGFVTSREVHPGVREYSLLG